MKKIIILLLALLPGWCQSQSNYFPDSEWRTSTPAEQGLDQSQIDHFLVKLKEEKILRPITSFSVVVNGYLVVDETFNGYNARTPHTLQSVTKSVTSTLVGVAIQNGFIKDLDQSVLSFFPEYQNIANMNRYKRDMTLHHALTMQTGQDWTGESHLDALNSYTGDRMKYVLDYEMETAPGRKWYYNSGIAILMGGLLQNATQMNTEEFAEQYLFQPMGISQAKWRWGHRGIPHTGGGLFLTPADMAKVGYLFLRNGRWKDQQILPTWWVDRATERHVTETENIAGISPISYGYMWWLIPQDRTDVSDTSPKIFMAYGHWGQFIFVIPDYDMVVVFTNNSSASYRDEIKPITLLYQYILPAVLNN